MKEKNHQGRTPAPLPEPVFWDSLLPVRAWQALHSKTQTRRPMERKQLFQNSVEDHQARREQRFSFCTNCGNALQTGDKFCSSCGHEIRGIPSAAAHVRVTSKSDRPPKTDWSTFALANLSIVLGILELGAVVNNYPVGLSVGPMIIFGALAYRSAKKRSLGLKKTNPGWWAYELILLMLVVVLDVGQNNFSQLAYTDPVNYIIIPAWILIAYVFALWIKPSADLKTHAP